MTIIGRQLYSNAQTRRENCVDIRRYRKTVAEVHGTWCTKNDARSLFPVGTRSDKMAVRKTSIFGEVYLFSDTVVWAFSEAALGEILALIYDAPRPPQFAIYCGSCFVHSEAQLNMGQSDSINNRTVKFDVSYSVVFKQVEVSTILASVESAGSWLHAGTCPMFMR